MSAVGRSCQDMPAPKATQITAGWTTAPTPSSSPYGTPLLWFDTGPAVHWNKREKASRAKSTQQEADKVGIEWMTEFLRAREMKKLRLEGPGLIPGGDENGWYKVCVVQKADKEMDGEAWHGTTLYAVYNILRDGMHYESHRTKQGQTGVYAHDLQTRNKAIHYGGIMEIQEGIFVKALVQLATNSEHRKKLKQTDQVVFDQVGVEAMAVWFKFYCTETIENGTRIARWTPGLEAPVGNVRKPSTTDTPRAKAMPAVPTPNAPVWLGAAAAVTAAAVVTATGSRASSAGTEPAGERYQGLRAQMDQMALQMAQMAQMVESLVQKRSRSASYESSRTRGYSRASSAGTYGHGRDRSADGRGYGSSARGRSPHRKGKGSHGHGRDRSAGSYGYGRSDRGRSADEGKGEGKASNEGQGASKGAGKASNRGKGRGDIRRKGSEGAAQGRRATVRKPEGGASPTVRQRTGRSPQRSGSPRRAVVVWKERVVTHQTGSRTAIVQPITPAGFEEDSADAPPVRVEVTTDAAACGAFEDVIDECDGHQTASRRKRCGSPGGVWWTVLVPDSMPGFNFDVRGLIRRRILAKEISSLVLTSRYSEAWELLQDHPAALGVTAWQAGAGYGLLHTCLVRNTPDWFMGYVFNRTAIPICIDATGVRTGSTALHLACSGSWVRVVQELAGVLSLSPHSLQGSTAAGPTSGGPPFFFGARP